MKLKIMKEKFLKLISPIKEPLWEFIKKVRSDSLDSISAQIAFFIVIAFIPFVMIASLSALKTILPSSIL